MLDLPREAAFAASRVIFEKLCSGSARGAVKPRAGKVTLAAEWRTAQNFPNIPTLRESSQLRGAIETMLSEMFQGAPRRTINVESEERTH